MSSITVDEARRRISVLAADSVGVCWVFVEGQRPWMHQVPAIRVRPSAERDGRWRVITGLFRWAGLHWDPAESDLADFVAWPMDGRVVPRGFDPPRRHWVGGWTAPQYPAQSLGRAT